MNSRQSEIPLFLCNLQETDLNAGLDIHNPVGFINPSSSLLPRAFTAEFGARFSF